MSEHKKEVKKRSYLDKILFLILLTLLVIVLIKYVDQEKNVEQTEVSVDFDTDLAENEIGAFAIHHNLCEQCYPTENVFGYLKQETKYELVVDEQMYEDSEKAKELVEKFGITKLPAVILHGDNLDEIEEKLPQFTRKGDYLILDAPQPPYYYIPTNNIIGYVELIYLKDPDCTICPKIGELSHDMQWNMGVGFSEKRAVYPNMTEYHELVEKYDIEKVPTYIFKGDLLEYENIKKYWERVGTIENDGALVLRLVNPPFLNPQTGEIEGIVDVTLLADKSCTENCIDINKIAENIKKTYAMYFGKLSTADVSSDEGKKITEDNMLSGEAIIFSKDAKLYPGFMTEMNESIVLGEGGIVIVTVGK